MWMFAWVRVHVCVGVCVWVGVCGWVCVRVCLRACGVVSEIGGPGLPDRPLLTRRLPCRSP
jgi:hypothetical protein